MNTLRWTLLVVTLLAGGGYTFLVFVGSQFRRSFGASPAGVLWTLVPVIGAAVLAAALMLPANKTLLHVATGVAVLLIGLCIWQVVAESATVLLFAVFYLVTWLAYYWMALSAGAGSVPAVK